MKKPIRRCCKSLKEFLKIKRKWMPKLFCHRHNWRRFKNYWYTWIWVEFMDEQLKDPYLLKYANNLYNKNSKNLKLIIDEVLNEYNWNFVDKIDGKTYYLRGIQISNEDYYYVYVSNDGDKQLITCVGKFDEIASYYGVKNNNDI